MCVEQMGGQGTRDTGVVGALGLLRLPPSPPFFLQPQHSLRLRVPKASRVRQRTEPKSEHSAGLWVFPMEGVPKAHVLTCNDPLQCWKHNPSYHRRTRGHLFEVLQCSEDSRDEERKPCGHGLFGHAVEGSDALQGGGQRADALLG